MVLPEGPSGGVDSGFVNGNILGHSRLMPGQADRGSVELGEAVGAGVIWT